MSSNQISGKSLLQINQEQRNRIDELEQQLELMRESHIRFVERLQAQLNILQEKFENLLDPEERTSDERPVQETPPNT